jgi:hypothetical protein
MASCLTYRRISPKGPTCSDDAMVLYFDPHSMHDVNPNGIFFANSCGFHASLGCQVLVGKEWMVLLLLTARQSPHQEESSRRVGYCLWTRTWR